MKMQGYLNVFLVFTCFVMDSTHLQLLCRIINAQFY